MIKAELHAHTCDDRFDHVPHTAIQLLDSVAALGYRALAITLHDRLFDIDPLASCARDRGVVLISGLERTIDGKHVLLINFPREAIEIRTFSDLARLKPQTNGVVIAPHPFYPIPSALGRLLDQHADLFDAVEVSALYVRGLNFNRKAIEWAQAHNKPLVGNADVHRLGQLGMTWSLIDADPEPDAISAAIRQGRVRVETFPMSYLQAALVVSQIARDEIIGRLAEIPNSGANLQARG